MANLVGHDVEVEAKRRDAAVARLMDADLEKTVAHEGIFQKIALQHQFEPVEVLGEMPFDRMAEILFPDIERETNRAEQMRGLEFRAVGRDVVEMTVLVRFCRGKH